MKKNIFISYIFLLIPFLHFSQVKDDSTIVSKIKQFEKSIDIYNAQIEELNSQIEVLKLQLYQDKIIRYALPSQNEKCQVVHHKAMSLCYDEKYEQARWVVHLITKDVEFGNVRRTNDFRSDPLVLSGTATYDDYVNTGYDRGHLAPSADFRWSKTALSESYFYSNMSPQKPELNRERWAELENVVRDWAIMNDEVFVVTGGILKDGLPVVKGSNTVSVPEYFYKVVVDYKFPEIKGIAFIMPNDTCNEEVFEYAVTINKVEEMTGIDFFAGIPPEQQEQLENTFDVELWMSNKSEKNIVEDANPMPSRRGQYNTVEAKNQMDKNCKVCGTVVSVKYAVKSKGAPTHINLDKKFPNHVFSATIWGTDRKNFSYAPEKELPGKKICIRGKIHEYKKIPQITITNEKQIVFLDDVEE